MLLAVESDTVIPSNRLPLIEHRGIYPPEIVHHNDALGDVCWETLRPNIQFVRPRLEWGSFERSVERVSQDTCA